MKWAVSALESVSSWGKGFGVKQEGLGLERSAVVRFCVLDPGRTLYRK